MIENEPTVVTPVEKPFGIEKSENFNVFVCIYAQISGVKYVD